MRHKYEHLMSAFLILILTAVFDLQANARPRTPTEKSVKRQNATSQHLKRVQLRHVERSDVDENFSSKESGKDNGDGALINTSGNESVASGIDNVVQLLEDPKNGLEDADDAGDDENGSDNINETKMNKTNEEAFVKISLKSGDIFTPYELLPVSTRLIKKQGKGIVSSSKNAKDMADRIFAAYFATMKRIITLKEEDIAGLDALQALAIDEESANLRYFAATTKKPHINKQPSDIWQKWIQEPRRSHYTLLTKKVSKTQIENDYEKDEDKRRQFLLKVKKMMPKNRHVIVNSNRVLLKKMIKEIKPKHSKTRVHVEPKRVYTTNRSVKINRKNNQKSGCTWRYECKKPDDLDTCNLITKCKNETFSNNNHKSECIWKYECTKPGDIETCHLIAKCKNETFSKSTKKDITNIVTTIPAALTADNKVRRSKHDRKQSPSSTCPQFTSAGLTKLDEEVEKIVISHMSMIKPEHPNERHEKIESLDQYFNNIIITQNEAPQTKLEKENGSTDSDDKVSSNEDKRDWHLPHYGIPLRRQPAEIKRSMSNASNDGSSSENDIIHTDKSTFHENKPKIVRLIN